MAIFWNYIKQLIQNENKTIRGLEEKFCIWISLEKKKKEFIVEWHQPRRKFKKENTSKGKLHLWLSFLALQIYWQLLTNNRHSFLRVVHAFKNYGRDSKKRLDRTSELNIWVYIDSFDLTNLLLFLSKELTTESFQQSKER